MRKTLLSLLLAFIAIAVQANDEYSTLVIETMEGTKFEISLQKKPKVQLDGQEIFSLYDIGDDKFVITCGKEITGYTYGEIRKFFFKLSGNLDVKPSADDRIIRVTFVDNTTVTISGIDNPEVIRLYTLDGSPATPRVEVNDAIVTVSLSTLDAGIYILNIDNKQTFKLMKR